LDYREQRSIGKHKKSTTTFSSIQLGKVIISGGGTGGHIFPAIAIANGLKQRLPEIDILFIGASDRMEMERVPAAGYPIEGLWISGLQRRLSVKNLSFPFKLFSSLIKAHNIIGAFQPNLVIGVGGYASGPPLYIASRKNIPTLIQEQNSYAGVTNRLLGKKVDRICTAYDGMEQFFPKDKILKTGNPIRPEIINNRITKEEGAARFGLDENKRTLLAMGGSLGARSINEGILENLSLLTNNEVQVIWQTGKAFYLQAMEAVRTMSGAGKVKEMVNVQEFIVDMAHAYSACDVIVSRAGAIAVSEICCAGKPTVLVPSPYVAEDHQTQNAKALVDKEAALLIKDCDTVEQLGQEAIRILASDELMKKLSQNIKLLAKPDATQQIVNEALALMKP
jgi:UDP-N-acetylglucosamine--N-acetylmuramyl-(pentapeptide) pyrophosphoryl-undecaprenol N-acetylglucosamine transferase